MTDESLEMKVAKLEQEIYLLRQENRGLKKTIREKIPPFKIERDDDIHNIVISFLKGKEYEPYIVFNLDTTDIDNETTEYLAEQVYEHIMEYTHE